MEPRRWYVSKAHAFNMSCSDGVPVSWCSAPIPLCMTHHSLAPPALLQKHCALNLMRGLQIAAGPGEGEVEVAHLTPSWVVSARSMG